MERPNPGAIDPFKLRYVVAARSEQIKREVAALCTQRSPWINVSVIAVIVISYGAGLALIMQPRPWLAAIGAASLLESMLLSWYLSHDCAHHLVLRGKRKSHALGEVLSWINGVAYFRFDEYCRYHIQHHAKQVDFIGVEIDASLAALPRWISQTLLALEVIYVPAMYGFIKCVAMLAVLKGPDRAYRMRVVTMLLVTTCFFAVLSSISITAVIWYVVVVVLRIHCIRFIDAFQHSYIQVPADQAPPPRGRRYEQHNTFSFPVARRFTALNLLILNFGYHNAHHALPSCPWYNLPALDSLIMSMRGADERHGDAPGAMQQVRFMELLRSYHRHRRYRITTTDEGQAYDDSLQFTMARFTGAFTDNLLG